jgi:hypothetical protein
MANNNNSDYEDEDEEMQERGADKILYTLIARGQTSLVDYSVREGNHVLLAQQILGKAKQDTVRRCRCGGHVGGTSFVCLFVFFFLLVFFFFSLFFVSSSLVPHRLACQVFTWVSPGSMGQEFRSNEGGAEGGGLCSPFFFVVCFFFFCFFFRLLFVGPQAEFSRQERTIPVSLHAEGWYHLFMLCDSREKDSCVLWVSG